MSKHLYFSGKLVKKEGRLRMLNIGTARQFESFVGHINEGELVDVFYEVTNDDGTLPQLAKLHVHIKQLAVHTGYSVDDMKLLIKDKAGLCIVRELSGKEYFLAKSFGECSKEELSLAIQACIQLGEEVNYLIH